MNTMLKFGLGAFAVLILLSSFSNCSKNNRYNDTYNVTVQQTIAQDAAAGLDLQAVGELVKRAKTGEEFEQLLNDSSVGINNLDLDENGSVDYIKVTEYGSENQKGFSLTVDLANNQTQEVATIEIEKTSEGQAHMQTYGNRNLYGSNHYYHSRTSFTDILLVSWLFSSGRPYYGSPWGYGHYPSYYRSYSTRGYNSYRRDMGNVTRSSTYSRANSSNLSASTASPNANKTANNIKAPLKSPTTSQKSFQARNPSKQIRRGGFGSQSKRTSSPTARSSSRSSYRSGGK